MCSLICKALQSSGSKAGTHFRKPHLLHGCQNVLQDWLLAPHNSFYSQHSLEMVRNMLVRDSLWKEPEKCANWSACPCFAQAEEVPQQTKHSMNFQLCARKTVVNLFSEGAITKSYLSVWKEGVGRKHVVILKNLKLRQKGRSALANPQISFPWSLLIEDVSVIINGSKDGLQSSTLPVLSSV